MKILWTFIRQASKISKHVQASLSASCISAMMCMHLRSQNKHQKNHQKAWSKCPTNPVNLELKMFLFLETPWKKQHLFLEFRTQAVELIFRFVSNKNYMKIQIFTPQFLGSKPIEIEATTNQSYETHSHLTDTCDLSRAFPERSNHSHVFSKAR